MLAQKLMGAKGVSGPAQFIAVTHTSSPYITAYPWSSSGFGTKFANPALTPTGNGYGAAFTEIK